MSVLRSVRAAAFVLVGAAVLGLVLANSPIGESVIDASHTKVGIAGTIWYLSPGHWASDALLAIFFLVAAIELRHELTAGSLRTPARALRPAVAAAGGVVVPIVLYLVLTAGTGQERGWPIPTATDIAFALGVLAIVGRGLPSSIRAFMLALAILDDLAAIILIAVVFPSGIDWLPLVGALAGVALIALLSAILARYRRKDGRGEHSPVTAREVLLVIAMVIVGIGVWSATLASGLHPTLAGVAIGLVLPAGPAHALRHTLEPFVNGVALPLFAFTAALVVIPAVPLSGLQPAFWGVLVALPLGKLVGIAVAAWVVDRIAVKDRDHRMQLSDLLAAGALGGIGFTVSLLMAQLAFADDAALIAETTLAVLLGSALSIVLATVLVAARSNAARRAARYLGRRARRVVTRNNRQQPPSPA